MLDVKPKALEAAGKQLRSVCGKIDQIFAQRNPPPPQEWSLLYEREVRSIFDAADLVEREVLIELRRELQIAWDERNEARHAITRLEISNVAMCKQLAALSRVLEGVKQSCLFIDDDGRIGVTADPHIDEQMFSDICTILNNTAKVAEQYQLVDGEHVVVPIEPTQERLERGLEGTDPAFNQSYIEIRREIYRITTAPTKPETER